MENDKKYSITMGLMIFCFVIIVALALGIGLGYIKIGGNTDKEDSDVGNISQVENNKEEQKVNLDDVYKKYDFDWASKKKEDIKNEIGNIYVQDGKIKIVGSGKTYYNGTTYDISKKIMEVNFELGNPLLAEVATYYDFKAFVVITTDGDVYISNEQEISEYRRL